MTMTTTTIAREYLVGPRIELTTPFGPAILHVICGDHVYFYAKSLTVHGVAYRVSLHMNRDGDTWVPTREAGLSVSRHYDGFAHSGASFAARKKLLTTLVPLIAKWAVSSPSTLALAQSTYINNECLRLETTIAEHAAAIEMLRVEVETLEKEIR